MLLATFLRKKKYPFTQAENGLISVQAVQSKPENFDVILMGRILFYCRCPVDIERNTVLFQTCKCP
jgi:hypothetical protein